MISPHSKAKVWWRCRACGHSWPATCTTARPGTAARDAAWTRRARTQSRVDDDRSLAALQPDLLEDLHPSRNPDGETGTRTRDTTIFSRVLYQLSYLALAGRC